MKRWLLIRLALRKKRRRSKPTNEELLDLLRCTLVDPKGPSPPWTPEMERRATRLGWERERKCTDMIRSVNPDIPAWTLAWRLHIRWTAGLNGRSEWFEEAKRVPTSTGYARIRRFDERMRCLNAST